MDVQINVDCDRIATERIRPPDGVHSVADRCLCKPVLRKTNKPISDSSATNLRYLWHREPWSGSPSRTFAEGCQSYDGPLVHFCESCARGASGLDPPPRARHVARCSRRSLRHSLIPVLQQSAGPIVDISGGVG